MNRIAQARPPSRAARNSRAGFESVESLSNSVRAQAQRLDEVFKSLARRVLINDDPASELPLRQLRVCLALYAAPLSMTQLSREFGVSQSAITQIADRLEAAKMVARSPLGDDRRVVNLQLTPRARKLLRLREEQRIERLTEVLERMPTRDREAAMASLAALQKAADQGPR